MRPSRRSRRTFLFGFVAAALITAGLFALIRPVQQSPYPELPALSGLYLSAYRHDHTDHDLFLSGLFGLKEKMKEADLILAGTSHMEFGINAGLLSALLGSALGHPVKVINLGRGYGDGVMLTRMILDANKIHDKIIVSDVYDLGILSDYARLVATHNSLLAGWKVLNTVTTFFKDTVLYGVLPAISDTDGNLRLSDPAQAYVLRDWHGFDVYNFATTTSGDLFRAEHSPPEPVPADKLERYGPANVLAMGPHWCARHRLRCVVTLIPFPAADLAGTAAWAEKRHLPFVRLSGEGLTYFDAPPSHLDFAGRDKITRRLATQLIPLLQSSAWTTEAAPPALEVSAYSPHETVAGHSFTLQPGGSSTLWFGLTRGGAATAPLPIELVVTWDGKDLPTAFDDAGLVMTASVSRDLYATPGHHNLAVVDVEAQAEIAHLDFTVLPVPPPSPPAILTVSDFGPRETAAGHSFNVQPDGTSALWIALARSGPATALLPDGIIATWDGKDLATTFDRQHLVVTTSVVPDAYAVPGHHDLALVDAESRAPIAHLDFVVR